MRGARRNVLIARALQPACPVFRRPRAACAEHLSPVGGELGFKHRATMKLYYWQWLQIVQEEAAPLVSCCQDVVSVLAQRVVVAHLAQ